MFTAQHQQPIYGRGIHSSSSYHWDHQLRIPSHDRITVSSHLSDSHWYSDSVLCPPSTVLSSNEEVPINQQQFPPHSSTTGPRAVIPSKRAAQNRAAQRAFRQRKERYVKDLEKKVKLMDEWRLEMDQLRQQNKDLRENNMRLEKQIHQQMISPTPSPVMMNEQEIVPAPVVVMMDNKKKRSNCSKSITTSFLPVNLRAPDQMISSPTSSCSSAESFNEPHLEQNMYHMAWNNYMSNHSLDDLCLQDYPSAASTQLLSSSTRSY